MTAAAPGTSRKRSPIRLVTAAIAFVVLVCVGISVLMYQPTEEDRVDDQVNAMIRAFEQQDMPAFLSGITNEVVVDVNDDREVLTRELLLARLSRLHSATGKISLSPGERRIHVQDGEARVGFRFTYKTRNSQFLSPGGSAPPSAELLMTKRAGNQWLIAEVELMVP